MQKKHNLDWLVGRKAIVAMLHVGALAATPRAKLGISELIDRTCKEAEQYLASGVDALAVENMHDIPYVRAPLGPEVVASMTAISCAVRRLSKVPVGIQILAGGAKEALAVALAAELDFIRVEGFVFAHVADEGIIEACAGDLLRYRKAIDAEHVAVFADIKKKHCSHSITEDVDIVQTTHAAEFFLADGVIVTGQSTGDPADLDELHRVKEASKVPVLVGSGVTYENVEAYLKSADGLIVGSHFKADGRWDEPVVPERVKRFMARVRQLRGK